mgnify:CR=1 FL=1
METLNLFDLYAKISLDTSDYEKAVKDATKQGRGLVSSFERIAQNSETTKNKIKLLASEYSAAKADVDRLTKAFNESAKENGYTSEQTKNLARELKDAEAKADGLKNELNQMVESTKKTGSGFSSLSSKLKSGLASAGKFAAKGIAAIGTAAGAAVGGLLALEQSTEEYRAAMGRLNTAFESAGYGADAANQAYSEFYGILGDTDRATEASQLLAKLADNEEDLAKWTNIAAGVNGTFGDSLPIESLIEAANETARTGQVVGTLADALNWAGEVGEDEFNAMLASCSSESERNQLIMETLAGTYDDAADSFYRNNEALVASRNTQAQLDESLAKVGAAVTTVKNAFLEQFAPAVAQAASKAADFISNVDPQAVVGKIQSLISAFETLLPVITGVTAATLAYKAATAISSVIDAVTKATQSMTIAQAALNAVLNANPFVLIATLIAGVVTALITLWTTNEDFRDAVKSAWDTVKTTISNAVSAIKTFFTETIPNAAQTAVDWLKGIPEQMLQVGKDLLMGLWNGISDKVQWLKDKVSGVVDIIKSWFTGSDGFDEHSPSKWAKQVFRYVMEGGGQGLEAGLPGLMSDVQNVTNRVKNGMDFGTANVDFASSGIGMASVGMVNGIASALSTDYGTGSPLTVNLVLPDGSKFATWQLPYLIQAGRAAGTPIANPQVG